MPMHREYTALILCRCFADKPSACTVASRQKETLGELAPNLEDLCKMIAFTVSLSLPVDYIIKVRWSTVSTVR